MNEKRGREAFMALSQETRLAIVRTLVKHGPSGLAAGAMSEAMGVSPSNVSFHLKSSRTVGPHPKPSRVTVDRLLGIFRNPGRFDPLPHRGLLPGEAGNLRALHRPLLPLRSGDHTMSDTVPDRPFNVLFLCTGNTARSILGKVFSRRTGPVVSTRSQPEATRRVWSTPSR